ncbi:hypothetical protein ACFPM7_00315 [Actinokineospora guangxiensis]|uniref:ABC transporter permease n=1 Tax=Actinokineospora guangxiensis TaxID=1490288 RepID=A0ABW0EHV2_9PSEU
MTADPTTWPALLHRWTNSWSSAARLAATLAVLVALLTAALLVLGDVTVEFGPIAVDRTPQRSPT